MESLYFTPSDSLLQINYLLVWERWHWGENCKARGNSNVNLIDLIAHLSVSGRLFGREVHPYTWLTFRFHYHGKDLILLFKRYSNTQKGMVPEDLGQTRNSCQSRYTLVPSTYTLVRNNLNVIHWVKVSFFRTYQIEMQIIHCN